MGGYLPQEFIRAIRDGEAVEDDAIRHFIEALSRAEVSDAQVGAFAMAVFFRDLSLPQRQALTLAMRDSGQVLNWDLPGPVLDKHSTGGVGDNVSLILAPLLAACGGFVPMISGRGLGHTGGTLDKLDAIPGYDSQPEIGLFRRVVATTGCAIIGQTADLAPADRKLYAIRSATATVESVSLITASILSKKLAAGLDALVLDIKCGNGAAMTELADARVLAGSLLQVARRAGLACRGLITRMDQPLASAAGNALEVENAIALLRGESADARLREVTLALAAELLLAGNLATTEQAARLKLDNALANGKAAECFGRMVRALGGPADLLENSARHLPEAALIESVPAPANGIIQGIDTRAVGLAVIALGGGRRVENDSIDPAVGFDRLVAIGEAVDKGQPLARIHARDPDSLAAARAMLLDACRITDDPAAEDSPVLEVC